MNIIIITDVPNKRNKISFWQVQIFINFNFDYSLLNLKKTTNDTYLKKNNFKI